MSVGLNTHFRAHVLDVIKLYKNSIHSSKVNTEIRVSYLGPLPSKGYWEKMGNLPHQAGLSILRSWPNDRNVGRTRIALIGGTRDGKSPMLDVQNLQRPDPNHPPTDYLIPLRNKMKIRAKKKLENVKQQTL